MINGKYMILDETKWRYKIGTIFYDQLGDFQNMINVFGNEYTWDHLLERDERLKQHCRSESTGTRVLKLNEYGGLRSPSTSKHMEELFATFRSVLLKVSHISNSRLRLKISTPLDRRIFQTMGSQGVFMGLPWFSQKIRGGGRSFNCWPKQIFSWRNSMHRRHRWGTQPGGLN